MTPGKNDITGLVEHFGNPGNCPVNKFPEKVLQKGYTLKNLRICVSGLGRSDPMKKTDLATVRETFPETKMVNMDHGTCYLYHHPLNGGGGSKCNSTF